MVKMRNLVKVGNREVKKRYIGNKLIFEDLPDKTEILSGEEIFTDKADDSVVHVEVDGKSVGGGSGKNLFNIMHHRYSSSITPNEWGGFDRSGGYGGITGSEIKVEPNQTYTFSYKVEYGSTRQEIYDGDGSILYILGTDRDVSFTPKHSTIMINMSNASAHNNVDSRITEIQLEEGSTATEYEPPAPSPDYPIEIHSVNDFDVVSQKSKDGLINKINLLLSEPLRSVGDVKDRLFRDSDGLWKIERNVGEISTWNNDSFRFAQEETNGVYRFNYNGPENDNFAYNRDNHNGDYLQSSHFSVDSDLRPFNANKMYPNGSRLFHISFDINNQYGITTSPLTVFEYFNSNRVQVMYQLAIPTIETLDQELQDKLNNLRSFQDSNYVYTVINGETVAENLKPTLHATFKSKGWYDYYLKTLLK